MLKKLNKKGIALLLATAVLLTAVVGTTLAYLVDVTGAIQNIFNFGKVACEVKFDENTNTYSVQNTGTVPAYIRVAVVINAADSTDSSKLTWDSNFTYWIAPDSDKWELHGKYYYYKGELAAGASVDIIQYTKSGTQIQILAEAIQATPDEAVQNAWKMTFNGTSWSVYTGK